MGRNNNGQKQVKTTHTSLDILEFIQNQHGASTAEIATHLGLAESTTHRHLVTLYDRGYLIKEGSRYDISTRFLRLGEYASRRTEEYVIAQRVTDEIAKETKEQAHFFVEEHGWAIQVYTEGGEHAVNSGPGRGYRLPLHSTASGKAILAHLPENRINEIIHEKELTSITGNTITEPDSLEEELAKIRERGYSKTKEEHVQDIHAVGAAILDQHGGVLGAFSISGPARRLAESEAEIGEYLSGRANEFELKIGFSSGDKVTKTVDRL